LEKPIELQPLYEFSGEVKQYEGCVFGGRGRIFSIRLFISVETVKKRYAKKPLQRSFSKF